jgi:acetyl-CoA carboxylase biotin carboxylase subunit
VHGATRADALAAMGAALAESAVEGIGTNLPLQRAIVAHREFARGDATTHWLDEALPELTR